MSDVSGFKTEHGAGSRFHLPSNLACFQCVLTTKANVKAIQSITLFLPHSVLCVFRLVSKLRRPPDQILVVVVGCRLFCPSPSNIYSLLC